MERLAAVTLRTRPVAHPSLTPVAQGGAAKAA